jgi:diphthamide biosynthesis methyltransferase
MSTVRLDASNRNLLSFFSSRSVLTHLLTVSGLHTYRVGMTVKLTEKTQEVNVALLKILEKDGLIKQLSEQLESSPFL